MKNILHLSALFLLITSCSDTGTLPSLDLEDQKDYFASTYTPMESEPTLFKSANIYDGLGGEFIGYDLLVADGNLRFYLIKYPLIKFIFQEQKMVLVGNCLIG